MLKPVNDPRDALLYILGGYVLGAGIITTIVWFVAPSLIRKRPTSDKEPTRLIPKQPDHW